MDVMFKFLAKVPFQSFFCAFSVFDIPTYIHALSFLSFFIPRLVLDTIVENCIET